MYGSKHELESNLGEEKNSSKTLTMVRMGSKFAHLAYFHLIDTHNTDTYGILSTFENGQNGQKKSKMTIFAIFRMDIIIKVMDIYQKSTEKIAKVP